jgi:hypothetical protein
MPYSFLVAIVALFLLAQLFPLLPGHGKGPLPEKGAFREKVNLSLVPYVSCDTPKPLSYRKYNGIPNCYILQQYHAFYLEYRDVV